MNTARSAAKRPRIRTTSVFGVVLCAVTVFSVGAVVADTVDREASLERALDRFASVWSAGDHAAVTEFIIDKGAVISLTRRTLSDQATTPARAHYLFQSLFRDVDAQELELTKFSPATKGDVAHAVFAWTYRRNGLDREERLFTSWTLWQGRWSMIELRLGR